MYLVNLIIFRGDFEDDRDQKPKGLEYVSATCSRWIWQILKPSKHLNRTYNNLTLMSVTGQEECSFSITVTVFLPGIKIKAFISHMKSI